MKVLHCQFYILFVLHLFIYSSINAQGTWKVFTKEDGLTSDRVYHMFKDSKGNIWFNTTQIDLEGGPRSVGPKGIMKYDGENWTNYYSKTGLQIINVIFEDSKGTVWLGTQLEGGLFVINGLRRINGSSFERISKKEVKYITEDSVGKIWFGANKLFSYDGNKVTKYSKKELGEKKITALYRDNADNIWVGTKSGVSYFDGDNWEIISNVQNCPTNSVYSIISDPEGNVWFGAKNGVFKFDGKDWQHYTVKDGLVGESTLEIRIDPFNNIIAIAGKPSIGNSSLRKNIVSDLSVALTNIGVSIFENGNWRAYSDRDGVPSNLNLDPLLWKIIGKIDFNYIEDISGNLWFNAHDNTIYKFDGITWTLFNESNGFNGSQFNTMIEDSKGNYWFGLNNGLGKFDGQNWSYFTEESGLPGNIILSIIEDDNDNIWFGTNKGVVKYTP